LGLGLLNQTLSSTLDTYFLLTAIASCTPHLLSALHQICEKIFILPLMKIGEKREGEKIISKMHKEKRKKKYCKYK